MRVRRAPEGRCENSPGLQPWEISPGRVQSPGGTNETPENKRFFSRPSGTDEGRAGSQPTAEAVGYFRSVPAGTGDGAHPVNLASFGPDDALFDLGNTPVRTKTNPRYRLVRVLTNAALSGMLALGQVWKPPGSDEVGTSRTGKCGMRCSKCEGATLPRSTTGARLKSFTG